MALETTKTIRQNKDELLLKWTVPLLELLFEFLSSFEVLFSFFLNWILSQTPFSMDFCKVSQEILNLFFIDLATKDLDQLRVFPSPSP